MPQIPSFPIDVLGAPSRSGYGLDHDTAALRLNDDGPIRPGDTIYRQVKLDPPDAVSLMWRFTDSQLYKFRLWFQNDLVDGANWFWIPLVMGDGTRDNVPSASSVKNVLAHFIDMPSQRMTGLINWAVVGQVEVAKRGRTNATTNA